MNFNKILSNFIIILTIFLVDRISKVYIIKLSEIEGIVDIYLTPFLNFYLIWNKGIAFGLLSFNESYIYIIITSIIIIISTIIMTMAIKSNGFKRLSLIIVFGGSIGNLFDRIYYSAVPDFIDFHIMGYHWFVFNIADIFITMGIICLILDEIFNDNKKNEFKN
ncbi:signal peptidase II [Candidatus Pelagibacter sp.]|nr:signal peptidase II [Candidatus Pelagibacter sp.]MDA9956317.1 signal peptidase II [Candidatus Pelagibacter sp.]